MAEAPARITSADVDVAVEDFLFLVGVGEHVDQALKRVRATPAAIEKRLRGVDVDERVRVQLVEAVRRTWEPQPARAGKRVPLSSGTCRGTCGRTLWNRQGIKPDGAVSHGRGGMCMTCARKA